MDDIKYWLALRRIHQLGTARFRRLEAFFGKLENAWNAPIAELVAAGLDYRTAQFVDVSRKNLSPDTELETVQRAEVTAINLHDAAYPPRLKEIADPPPVIYCKGTLLASDERAVAIVGTRNSTSYGKEAASVLSRELAISGLTVVRGLALGIAGVAHRAALECGGRTIAVVAGGLDSVYPKEHSGLSRQVQDQGAVISEQPLGVRLDARSFPRRNRLIKAQPWARSSWKRPKGARPGGRCVRLWSRTARSSASRAASSHRPAGSPTG